jgi:hypothetical protein
MSPIVCRGDFVYGEFREMYDYGRTQAYIKESTELCRQNKCKKVLMDIRGVTGKISTLDRFKLAQSALQHYGRDMQVVVVYRAEEVDGFFENVVVNRGGNFRIFTDLASACKWLGIEESAVVVK